MDNTVLAAADHATSWPDVALILIIAAASVASLWIVSRWWQ